MFYTIGLTILGAALLTTVFVDVYATILRATKRSGPISENLNRLVWFLATRIAKNFERRWRHRFLTSIGPMLMPVLVSLFILMLIAGFALIYYPRIETSFNLGDKTHSESFAQSFYFSGVTLLTIGYGDIQPRTTSMRLMALLEGASGLAVLSLSITYLLTVYGALERKRAVALNFYHQARQGADVPNFITLHFARGQFYGLTNALKDATRELHELLESHIEHPVIHYFHPLEVYKGLPRVIFVMLETVTILRSCLDSKEYVEAGDHPDVAIAEDSVRHVLNELLTALNLEKRAAVEFENEIEEESRRKNCFRRAMRELSKAGVKLRTDQRAAFGEYSKRREEWETKLYYFADFLGYDWDEVTGDRDFADAIDDEVEERHDQIEMPQRHEEHQI